MSSVMDIRVKVGVIVVGHDGKCLLIKEKHKEGDETLWNIIKGTYEGGETIFDAAMRECREEASIGVELTHSLATYISQESGRIRVQCNFLALALDGNEKIAPSLEQKTRDESIEEVRWFTKEEIRSMKPKEFISNRAYELLMDWVAGKIFPLEVNKQVRM